MRYVIDASGERHDFDVNHARVVSLVPSTTETIFALKAESKLVGVTRYCVRPAEAQRLRVVGGTKSPRIEEILMLKPDLVLANHEENREQDVTSLRKATAVYVAYPRDLEGAVSDIRALGELLNRHQRAEALASEIEDLRRSFRPRHPFRYLYLVWRNPYMVAGRRTFIDSVLTEAGGVNVAPDTGRYPEMAVADIVASRPDVVLLSSEPFPFSHEDADELRQSISSVRTILVDGELLSWHGARLRHGLPYLQKLVTSI